jgi:hypothetical protein
MLEELPEVWKHLRDNGIYIEAKLVKVGQCPTLKTRATHTTGEQPYALKEAFMTWQKTRKKFKLVGKLADLKPAGEDDVARGYQGSASQTCHGFFGGDDKNSNDRHVGSDVGNDQDAAKSDGGSSDSNADWALFSEKLKEHCGVDVSAEVLNTVANDCGAFYMDQLRSAEDVPGTETPSFTRFLQNTLAGKARINVNNKAELMNHVKACLQTFVPQYMKPFLESLPLEGELATANLETLWADGTRLTTCLQELSDQARVCLHDESFLCFLNHCSSEKSLQGALVEMALKHIAKALTATLDEDVRRSFKKAKREQVVLLKRRIRDSDIPDGVHASAALLREMVLRAMSEAFAEVDIDAICECVWKEKNAQAPSSSSTKAGWRSGPRIETQPISEEQTRMMEKEASRMANKFDKQMKGGKQRKITDAGRSGKNRVRQIDLI